MQFSQEDIYGMAPFAKTLGLTFPELTAERVTARLEADETLSTVGGTVHGGVIMSICDVAAAVCTGLNLAAGGWTTAESTTWFLRAVPLGTVTATATPTKVGRRLVQVEVDVHAAERHCARTGQLLQVLEG